MADASRPFFMVRDMQVQQKVKDLTNKQKFLITVSVLDESTKQIQTNLYLNNFLTADIPIVANELSGMLSNTYRQQTTVKHPSVIEQEKVESGIKGILE